MGIMRSWRALVSVALSSVPASSSMSVIWSAVARTISALPPVSTRTIGGGGLRGLVLEQCPDALGERRRVGVEQRDHSDQPLAPGPGGRGVELGDDVLGQRNDIEWSGDDDRVEPFLGRGPLCLIAGCIVGVFTRNGTGR